jgi:hypothetical protein
MKLWTRRSLVFGGFFFGSVIGLGAAKFWCSFVFSPQSKGSTSGLIATLYPASEAVKFLGRAYLDQTRNTVVASLRRIEHHQRIQRALRSGCPIEIRLALDQACRSDFQAGRTFCIDGWVLGQTELDIAVLCIIA